MNTLPSLFQKRALILANICFITLSLIVIGLTASKGYGNPNTLTPCDSPNTRNITDAQGWTGSVFVDCLITVKAGGSLSIAGASVYFDPGANGLNVENGGSLTAFGSSFFSDPLPGNWAGIHYQSGSSGSVLSSSILYSGQAIYAAAGLRIEGSDILVQGNTFSEFAREAIWVQSASPTIISNTFQSSAPNPTGFHVLYFQGIGAGTGLVFQNNIIANNPNFRAATMNLFQANGTITFGDNQVYGNKFNGMSVNQTNGDAISGSLTLDWTDETSLPLIFSSLGIDAEDELYLTPGTVLKWVYSPISGAGDIYVAGKLDAQGAVFTSIKDDSYGGDTNADGNATAPARGDWGGIWFLPGSTGTLNDCVISYGGTGDGGGVPANIQIESSNVSVTDCTISYSLKQGMRIINASPEIASNAFINNYDNNTSPTSSALSLEGIGANSDILINNNIITGTQGAAVTLQLINASGQVNFSGNSASNNTINGVVIPCCLVGGGGSIAGELELDFNDLPLVLASDLVVNAGAELTLSPGMVVKGVPQGAGSERDLQVYGSLTARDVVFTSVYDDLYGGDTHGDGNATLPAPGDWGGIWFRAGSSDNWLENCRVLYGGRLTNTSSPNANIRIGTSDISIKYCAIQYSGVDGIAVENNVAPNLIRCNAIEQNGITGSNPLGKGLINYTNNGTVVDASWNWWGDPTGPYHPTANPGGLGNRVSDFVIFQPYKTGPIEFINLAPQSATHGTGEQHTVTATLQTSTGFPVTNRTVTTTIASGPHAGLMSVTQTDANGQTTFSYTGMMSGTDTLLATFVDNSGETISSNQVTSQWITQPSIQGTVYNDMNGNGTQDTGEPSLPDWTILLEDQNGVVLTTTTNSQGGYIFTNPLPGDYRLSEQTELHWVITEPMNGIYELSISSEETITGMDFGNRLRYGEACATAWDIHLHPDDGFIEFLVGIFNYTDQPQTYGLEIIGFPEANVSIIPPPPYQAAPTSTTYILIRVEPIPTLAELANPHWAVVTNLGGGYSFTCMGQIWSPNSAFYLHTSTGVTRITFGEAQTIIFSVQNLTNQPLPIDFVIEAMVNELLNEVPFKTLTESIVSLNGLPPGQNVSGQITIPPSQTVTITVDVELLADVGFFFGDIILYADVDGDGLTDAAVSEMILPTEASTLFLPIIIK